MQDGLDDGYSERQVMNGVIKAVKAGSSVRRLSEGAASEEKTLVVKDSATLSNQMENTTWETTQKENDFVCKMIKCGKDGYMKANCPLN